LATGTEPAAPYSWEYTTQTQEELDESQRECTYPALTPKMALTSSIPPWYPRDYRPRLLSGLPRCGLSGTSIDGLGVSELTGSYPEAWPLSELLVSHPIWRLWVAASPLESCKLTSPDAVDIELNVRSWHLSISSAYVTAWIVVAVVWQRAIFSGTNIGLFIVLYVVTGLSLASWTQLVAVPFAAAPTLAAITGPSYSCVYRVMKLMYSNFPGDHPCYRRTTFP
jgi:hypothetical protein